jgi:hypothetical protein
VIEVTKCIQDCKTIADTVKQQQCLNCCDVLNGATIDTGGGDLTVCSNIIINNTPGYPPPPPPGEPTTPSGSPAAVAICSVDPTNPDIIEGKYFAGKEVEWQVSYTPSAATSSAATVTLTQTFGPVIRAGGEATDPDYGKELTAPKLLSTRPVSEGPFLVYTPPPPADMKGYFFPEFTVQLEAKDLAGVIQETMMCSNTASAQAQGGCGGCFVSTVRPIDVAVNAALLALIPLGMMLGLRKRAARK